MSTTLKTDEEIARLFHDTYERLAPEFGYETRKDTKQFDPTTPNGKLMIAVCGEVAAAITQAKSTAGRKGEQWETVIETIGHYHGLRRADGRYVIWGLSEIQANTIRDAHNAAVCGLEEGDKKALGETEPDVSAEDASKKASCDLRIQRLKEAELLLDRVVEYLHHKPDCPEDEGAGCECGYPILTEEIEGFMATEHARAALSEENKKDLGEKEA